MFPLFKVVTSQKKKCQTTQNTATPSGSNAMKFSTEVSEVHAATRIKSPEAADANNKVCIEAFQQLLSTSPGTQTIIFSLCSASEVATF